MQVATAEAQIGAHNYRLTVQEDSGGIFTTSIFDMDRNATVARNVGPKMLGETPLNQTLENALEDAETDLCAYLGIIGEEWPRGVRIEWSRSVLNQL